MKKYKYKKGQAVMSNWIFWLFFCVAASAGALYIVYISNSAVNEASRIPKDVEDELVLVRRFINSDECFAYVGEINGIITDHAKLVDSSKFTQVNLNRCFHGSTVNYAYSLTLHIPDLFIDPGHNQDIGPISTTNWQEGTGIKTITEGVLVMIFNRIYGGRLIIKIKDVE